MRFQLVTSSLIRIRCLARLQLRRHLFSRNDMVGFLMFLNIRGAILNSATAFQVSRLYFIHLPFICWFVANFFFPLVAAPTSCQAAGTSRNRPYWSEAAKLTWHPSENCRKLRKCDLRTSPCNAKLAKLQDFVPHIIGPQKIDLISSKHCSYLSRTSKTVFVAGHLQYSWVPGKKSWYVCTAIVDSVLREHTAVSTSIWTSCFSFHCKSHQSWCWQEKRGNMGQHIMPPRLWLQAARAPCDPDYSTRRDTPGGETSVGKEEQSDIKRAAVLPWMLQESWCMSMHVLSILQ